MSLCALVVTTQLCKQLPVLAYFSELSVGGIAEQETNFCQGNFHVILRKVLGSTAPGLADKFTISVIWAMAMRSLVQGSLKDFCKNLHPIS